MKTRRIEFKEEKASKLSTKFGGQPDWIAQPQWPVSKETGNPMRFICQIDLSEFNTDAKMAYLFLTDEEEYVDGTWEPDGGENAIILQPSTEIYAASVSKANGPTLYKMVKKLFSKNLAPKDVEFSISLKEEVEPEFVNESDRSGWTDERLENYAKALDKNKIGGTPLFLQGTEFPDSGKWDLLMQIDSTKVPFFINFGGSGVGYAFLSEDGKKAKFLWQ